MKGPLVVNLIGAPGAGKSTLAAYVFARLKMDGVNCELVTEFAKDKVWEANNAALENQVYIFAKQYYRIDRCAGKVDVIITDSPLILSGFYNRDSEIDKPLKELIAAINRKYTNYTYFVKRVKAYNPVGRNETEAESDAYVSRIKELLDQHGVVSRSIDGDLLSTDIIVSEVRDWLEENRKTGAKETHKERESHVYEQ